MGHPSPDPVHSNAKAANECVVVQKCCTQKMCNLCKHELVARSEEHVLGGARRARHIGARERLRRGCVSRCSWPGAEADDRRRLRDGEHPLHHLVVAQRAGLDVGHAACVLAQRARLDVGHAACVQGRRNKRGSARDDSTGR